ncbi:MAG: glycosyltransferase family 2 protein [Flavobacteriales bacterium]|jgi:glycosyltransferase involved in cell wall biosynthesis|tara:strand:+ start:2391 stop:3353 length:963 start_codon:yes stop_codon:yes gene_type:complete
MQSNLVSIIVPFYNVEQYIDRCIKSLLSQTYLNLEILLVDDCSPDNTLEIVQQYANNDSRIKILQYDKNRGLGGARNYGIEQAKGEYILFVDSDDYIEANTVEGLYEKAKDNNLCVLEANYLKEGEISTEVLPRKSYYSQKVFSGKEYWESIPIAPVVAWNKFYKLSFLKENNIKFKLRKFEDVAFTAEVFMKAKRVMNIDFPFYHYIVRENSIMTETTTKSHLEDAYVLINDMKVIFDTNKENEQMKKSYLYSFIGFFRLWHLYSDDKLIKKHMKKKVLNLFFNTRKLVLGAIKLGIQQRVLLFISPILTAKLYLLRRG